MLSPCGLGKGVDRVMISQDKIVVDLAKSGVLLLKMCEDRLIFDLFSNVASQLVKVADFLRPNLAFFC